MRDWSKALNVSAVRTAALGADRDKAEAVAATWRKAEETARAELEAAEAAASASAAALAEGGDSSAFHADSAALAAAKARLQVIVERRGPAEEAAAAASAKHLAAVAADAELNHRARAAEILLPAADAVKASLGQLAEDLRVYADARAKLQSENPAQDRIVFPPAPNGGAPWSALARLVPPEVRSLVGPIFEDIRTGLISEAGFLAHDPDALDKLETLLSPPAADQEA